MGSEMCIRDSLSTAPRGLRLHFRGAYVRMHLFGKHLHISCEQEEPYMAQLPKYYIVEAKALPEVFLKVAEAKWLLETGEVATVNDAARATGISRSAFYKYRDSISPFQNLMAGRILTFQFLLRDMTGLLSSILTIFAQFGANILTINQAIPTNGCASVTISAETSGISQGVEALMRALSQVDGVRKVEVLAG